MKENYIIIENVIESELESILMNLANIYRDVACADGIQLYRKKDKYDSFLVLFTNQPDFMRFNYFVNYLKYPENFMNFNPFLRGFFKTTDIQEKQEFSLGEWLMIYISKNDKKYDNVSLVNDQNQSFLIDFGERVNKLETTEENYQLITFDKNNYYHITDIIPSIPEENPASKPWWKFW